MPPRLHHPDPLLSAGALQGWLLPSRFHWLTRALPSQSVNRTYSEGSLCSLITGPNHWKPITAGTLRPLFKAWMTCDSRPHRSSEYAPSAKTRVAPATHLGRRTAWPPPSRQFRHSKWITTRAHPPRTEAALLFSLSYSHMSLWTNPAECTSDHGRHRIATDMSSIVPWEVQVSTWAKNSQLGYIQQRSSDSPAHD